ncbi:MAG TPA: hypothetical protein VFZ34_16750 [Blastocatellia bacterium]|nr:hypothetical protein [Blastocatellia bacterium]
MSLPNEKFLAPPNNQEAEREKIKQEIAQLMAVTPSAKRRKLLELSARILETDAPLLDLDEINEMLGRKYRYE